MGSGRPGGKNRRCVEIEFMPRKFMRDCKSRSPPMGLKRVVLTPPSPLHLICASVGVPSTVFWHFPCFKPRRAPHRPPPIGGGS
jgi:hypothetical protein